MKDVLSSAGSAGLDRGTSDGFRPNGREIAEGIFEVGDFSEGGADTVFAGLFGAYQEQGRGRGYQRGVSDTLASLLVLIEQFAREQPDDPDLRRQLYRFHAFVERRIDRQSGAGDAGYLSGGLGI